MGNYDLAVKDFQEVMSLDPNNAEVHFHSFKDYNFFYLFYFLFLIRIKRIFNMLG